MRLTAIQVLLGSTGMRAAYEGDKWLMGVFLVGLVIIALIDIAMDATKKERV